jgi:hypothetical protein
MRNLVDWYFRPRAFEAGSLYPRMGVRWFKKYLPSSGELVSRWRGVDRLKIAVTGDRRKALLNYVQQTRVWEGRHLVSAVLLQAWAVGAGFTVGAHQFWICTAINLVVNIHPMLIQRLNRARIAQMLARNEPAGGAVSVSDGLPA